MSVANPSGQARGWGVTPPPLAAVWVSDGRGGSRRHLYDCAYVLWTEPDGTEWRPVRATRREMFYPLCSECRYRIQEEALRIAAYSQWEQEQRQEHLEDAKADATARLEQ